jgi:ribosomal protein S18 acetylase RimI-like enzyme
MTNLDFETVFDPSREVLESLWHGLDGFNRSVLGGYDYARLAVVVRNEDGDVIGGLCGDLLWDWLHVQCLWVDEGLRDRGVGTKLVRMAEDAAVSKGIDNIHLETTSFQALDFYLKNGYEVFGQLEGKPAGHTWYYLKKENIVGGR